MARRTPPAGSDAAAGNASARSRTSPRRRRTRPTSSCGFTQPIWDHPADVAAGATALADSGAFVKLDGPLSPTGAAIPAVDYARLHAALGNPALLPATEPSKYVAEHIPLAAYEIYHATAGFVSADGRTIMYEVSLKVGNPDSNAAINSVPRPAPGRGRRRRGGARRAKRCRR